MNKKLKLDLTIEAQKRLIENPQNWAHEITHHFRVLQNAHRIIGEENLNLNIDIVDIICMWHDVALKEDVSEKKECVKTAKYLASFFKGDEKRIIYDSILHHEFGSNPKYIEGKVLQDADKLDILSIDRINLDIEAKEAGFNNAGISKKVVEVILKKWLPIMPERYHFSYSIKSHKKRLKTVLPVFKKYLTNNK